MFVPKVKILEDISPNDKLGKGRRFVVLYENTPMDSNAVLMTAFDFEMIFKKYSKMREEMGDVKCRKCNFYSSDTGYCPGCNKKLKDIKE